jgi:hypothetical protein
MSLYKAEGPVSVKNHINNFGSNVPGVASHLSFIDLPPKLNNKRNVSIFRSSGVVSPINPVSKSSSEVNRNTRAQQSQSSIILAEKSSSKRKLGFIRYLLRISLNILLNFTPLFF